LKRNPPLIAQLVGKDDWLSHQSKIDRGPSFLKMYGAALTLVNMVLQVKWIGNIGMEVCVKYNSKM